MLEYTHLQEIRMTLSMTLNLSINPPQNVYIY